MSLSVGLTPSAYPFDDARERFYQVALHQRSLLLHIFHGPLTQLSRLAGLSSSSWACHLDFFKAYDYYPCFHAFQANITAFPGMRIIFQSSC